MAPVSRVRASQNGSYEDYCSMWGSFIGLSAVTAVDFQVRDSGYAEYVRPPIDRYHTLQFGCFDEICEVGYAHARDLFNKWSNEGRITDLFAEKKIESDSNPSAHKFGSSLSVETKFTDLAELVSRINRPRMATSSSVAASAHVSDDEMSVTSEPAIASAAMPASPRRRKAGSEGTSPGSVTVSSDDADDDERRLHDFDEDEMSAQQTST